MVVVDDQTTMHDINAGTWMTKANPIQIGNFLLEVGKELKLSRKSSPGRNCVNLDQPCGALDYCCDGLYCDGYIDGRCHSNFCVRYILPCLAPVASCCSGVCLGVVCA
ncbi:hypothetical protein Tco_1412822 [Tanacetum coccineum]